MSFIPAELAAWYSKGRAARRVEVHVCFARDVSKPRGFPPGKVMLARWTRLRVEPHPTYYLRTARAYDFLQAFLHERVGQEELATLHGLAEEGERPRDLAAELDQMRTLFYGLYLISCEDLGMRPSTTSDETGDPAAAVGAAEKWLGDIIRNPASNTTSTFAGSPSSACAPSIASRPAVIARSAPRAAR